MNRLSPASKFPGSIWKLISVAALVILLMPTLGGCKGVDAGNNPLIGSWRLSSSTGDSTTCASTYVFKDSVSIVSYPGTAADPKNPYSEAVPARTVSVPVIRYMPSATLVVAMTGGQGFPMDHVNYNFTDGNHMWNETAYGKCYYERTN